MDVEKHITPFGYFHSRQKSRCSSACCSVELFYFATFRSFANIASSVPKQYTEAPPFIVFRAVWGVCAVSDERLRRRRHLKNFEIVPRRHETRPVPSVPPCRWTHRRDKKIIIINNAIHYNYHIGKGRYTVHNTVHPCHYNNEETALTPMTYKNIVNGYRCVYQPRFKNRNVFLQ